MSVGSPTPTPTPSIYFFEPIYRSTGAALLCLKVNGSPETAAAVTLSGPGGSAPLTYSITLDPGTGPCAYYGNTMPFAYQAGEAYTITAVTSAGTATVFTTAPGGNVTNAADGTQASWDEEGNEDFIQITDSGATEVFRSPAPDIASPYTVPVTAYPGPGTYDINTVCRNATAQGTNVVLDPSFRIIDSLLTSVTK